MPKTREVTVLAVAVAFLVVLVGLLVVLTDSGGGASPVAAVDATPASPREDRSVEQAGSVRVVPLLVPGPAEDRIPAPVQDVADMPTAAPQPNVDPGAFPEIVADYRAIGFDVYTRALARIGARFFVVRKPAFNVVSEVDPVDFDFITGDDGAPLDGLSPRSREISAEPRLQGLLARAGAVFGDGRYGAIVLLPQAVERRLITALGEIGRGAEGEIDNFICSYRLTGDTLVLQVTAIRTKAGRVITVDRSVRLTANHLPRDGSLVPLPRFGLFTGRASLGPTRFLEQA